MHVLYMWWHCTMCDLCVYDVTNSYGISARRLLQGSDSKNSHVVYGQDVEIFASRASCLSQPTTGSSKVGEASFVCTVSLSSYSLTSPVCFTITSVCVHVWLLCPRMVENQPDYWRICSSQLLHGRPGVRFHVGGGGQPTDVSTWQSSSEVKRYTINDISYVPFDIRIANCHARAAYRK